MPGNRQRTETLDGLAWASISEEAVIARLANKLAKEHAKFVSPTKKAMQEAISATVPPRGRCGPMLEPLQKEYERQSPIIWERRETQVEWDAWKTLVSTRHHRINHTYASIFGRAVNLPHRNNPYHWNDEKHRKWNEAEGHREKGDDCALLIKAQDCVIAVVVESTDESNPGAHIKVKRLGSGYVYTTYLRVRCENFGSLFASLGGFPVTGALAHGEHVKIDWRGRKFIITDKDGETRFAPWLAIKKTKTGPNHWDYKETPIQVMGRKVTTLDASEVEDEDYGGD
jgi:hypothetical protein